MTVYEELEQIKQDSEATIADYTRQIHNAPYLDHGPCCSTETKIKVCNDMIAIFARRVAALSAALAALPIEVAESEV